MSNTAVSPVVCKPIVKGQQCFSMLEPLAGVIGQDNTPYTSDWLFIGAGSYLEVKLNVANFVGTLAVAMETVQDVSDPPRLLGTFPQTPGVAGSAGLIGGPPVCAKYVRVVATPGQGAGQTCDWSITGQAIVPFAPIT
jgi:hypothetical protein